MGIDRDHDRVADERAPDIYIVDHQVDRGQRRTEAQQHPQAA
jgi:hypothetical protein